jgi:endonuclease/exonuclease/phosphatase (EEP) superfamily protein YafD
MRPILPALLTLLPVLAAAASPPAPTALPFRAMAYNVLYDAADVEASLAAIDSEQPDFVCLRELTPKFAKAFRKRFARQYPHMALEPRKGTWGVGIASRHPLARTRHFPEKPHRLPALEADVQLSGRTLKVVCVHLMPPVAKHRKSDTLAETMDKNAELRTKQGRALMERYAQESGALLLLGDMNEGREGGAMKAFRSAGFVHACEGPRSACGNTWPGATTVLPAIVEIDHILGRGLTFEEARVVRKGGSDHFPVVARFGFTPPAPAPGGRR